MISRFPFDFKILFSRVGPPRVLQGHVHNLDLARPLDPQIYIEFHFYDNINYFRGLFH